MAQGEIISEKLSETEEDKIEKDTLVIFDEDQKVIIFRPGEENGQLDSGKLLLTLF